MKTPSSIDQHIQSFSPDIQEKLESLRQTIQQEAPDATECISYGIPTFKLHGNLVHFAGYKNHIGFYPGSEAIQVFEMELRDYETSKGTIKFPLDQPLPLELVTQIVRFRVEKNSQKKKAQTES